VSQKVYRLNNRHAPLPASDTTLLPYGNGRSYGDSCLNPGGALLDVRGLDRFITFDETSGKLRCESGVLLSELHELAVPRGWFLPVTPGTQFVTVGGAIANDVHGKNHHRAGTFGCHVLCFELLRSDGSRRICSTEENSEWFAATIGGLGLTGLITWAELQLRRVDSIYISAETIRFGALPEFFELSGGSDTQYEYTVAWLDCSASGRSQGRGLFTRGNHLAATDGARKTVPQRSVSLPLTPRFSVVNGPSLRLFNALYYHKQLSSCRRTVQHYASFLYPLDGFLHWNRLYGPDGFFQYQCVVPQESGCSAVREMLGYIARSDAGSFLTVLKVFGRKISPGLLSFAREGVTFAVDFPNRGERTLLLMSGLDSIVSEAGGAVYPAKDARMTGDRFRHYFPQWKQFETNVDPLFSSGFWRRVMQ